MLLGLPAISVAGMHLMMADGEDLLPDPTDSLTLNLGGVCPKPRAPAMTMAKLLNDATIAYTNHQANDETDDVNPYDALSFNQFGPSQDEYYRSLNPAPEMESEELDLLMGDLQYHRNGTTELDLDQTESHRRTLELDERSQVDQLTSCSGAPSASSFPPVVSIISCSNTHSISLSRRGRGRIDTPCNNCSWVGHVSGAVWGCSNRKPAHSEVPCGLKKQSPKIGKDAEFSWASSAAQSLATPSALPLFGTVQIMNRAGKLMPLWAEVDRFSEEDHQCTRNSFWR